MGHYHRCSYFTSIVSTIMGFLETDRAWPWISVKTLQKPFWQAILTCALGSGFNGLELKGSGF